MLIIAVIVLVVGLSVASVFIFLNAGNETDCGSYSYDECPDECVVCPPCEVCSSISCGTEEFCESIGFNRTWYEDIKTRLPG
jgi:hypothetical protein